METLELIFDKYEWPKRNQKPLQSVGQIETALQFKLPNDYLNFIQKYLGFDKHIGREFVYFWDLDELIKNNIYYGISEKLTNTLGIGSNGGDEFIAIEMIENGNYRIVLSPFIDLDKQYHIEIGTSFTDFLIRLDNEIEWFE